MPEQQTSMIQALLSLPNPYIEKRNRLSEQITNRNNEMHTLKQQAAASDTGTQSASSTQQEKSSPEERPANAPSQ